MKLVKAIISYDFIKDENIYFVIDHPIYDNCYILQFVSVEMYRRLYNKARFTDIEEKPLMKF